MKKTFLLPIFVMALFAGQATAQTICTSPGGGSFCQFDTGCYEMSAEYSSTSTCAAGSCTCAQIIQNCISFGTVFRNVTGLNESNGYGAGLRCTNQGGQWTNEGADPNRQALGCCRWETESNCYTIWSGVDPSDGIDGAIKVQDCNGGLNRFWNGACPTGGACPTTPPVYDGTNPADGFCCWDANEYNNYVGACVPISSTTTLTSCLGDSGRQVTACGSCNTSGTYVSTGVTSANLTVLARTSSLHISSARDATVQLFDMNGKQVYSEKLSAGYNVVSFGKQKQGVYYALVQSGAHKQSVKVVLK
ncbi:MAG: T9SS type A sorting domain-containing protein [Fibromonadaceae bacterium]|nr:T9SS type A sorting domain-containing protein [Fibromonadaceae bacterium]